MRNYIFILTYFQIHIRDSVFVQHFQNRKTVKVICDKARKWKGKHLAILPLENQSYVDYRMVLRIMQEEILATKNRGKKLTKN